MDILPFAQQNKAEVWPRIQNLLKLLFELKVLNESKQSMFWVRSAFCNVLFSIFYWFVFTFFQLCHCNSVYQYNGPTLSKQWGLFKVCRTQFNMDINEPLSIQNPPRKPDSRLESWKSESGNDFADLWQLLTFISVFIFQTRSAAAIMCSPSYQ